MKSTIESYNLGRLGVIGMSGCETFCEKVDYYLKTFNADDVNNLGTFLLPIKMARFGTGEAKVTILHSIRTFDVYLIVDVFNYGVTYKMYGQDVPMSPDDHFQDLKRVISAMCGKAKKITVIMPMLYEGRQHKRTARESLDCAVMLQELFDYYGIDNIITFDAHDPRVMNAIPTKGFENVYTTYQMIKALVNNIEDFKIDKDNLMIISPDEGGVGRGVYYSSVLGIDLGMFYKRRDYSRVVKGRNPIIAHEFLGSSLENKDVIVVDDMISSGESMIDVAKRLKDMGARNIYVCCAFGLFCNGLEAFDEAYENGWISRVFTTNLIYRSPELLERKWFCEVDLSKYISLIIDALNHDMSISSLLNHAQRIKPFLEQHGYDIKITE